MNNKKMNNKKTKGIITLLLTIALIFTSALAWHDLTQHKTNKFTAMKIKITSS